MEQGLTSGSTEGATEMAAIVCPAMPAIMLSDKKPLILRRNIAYM